MPLPPEQLTVPRECQFTVPAIPVPNREKCTERAYLSAPSAEQSMFKKIYTPVVMGAAPTLNVGAKFSSRADI
jgi:hypothetical protein